MIGSVGPDFSRARPLRSSSEMSDFLLQKELYFITFGSLFLAPLKDFPNERRGIAASVDVGEHDAGIWRELEASNVVVPCQIGRREDGV